MAKNDNGSSAAISKTDPAISAITVSGFKSLANACRAEIRPLTILAGANSSGKSSIIQPLLLMKQTLEGTYDPGPLLLDGPNVRFTKSSQLLSKSVKKSAEGFSVKVEFEHGAWLTLRFSKSSERPLDLVETTIGESGAGPSVTLSLGLSQQDIFERVPGLKESPPWVFAGTSEGLRTNATPTFKVSRERCFLFVAVTFADGGPTFEPSPIRVGSSVRLANDAVRRLIHVPGLRGNPARSYTTTAVGATFPGKFEEYAASVVHSWQNRRDPRLQMLGKSLASLGLTWKVAATPVNETEVELEVGRLPGPRQGGARDLVSIADVGFGVSQVLPVVVSLLVADPGQVVYVEQPEIHLHPRAQVGLSQVLIDAANRGVRVIVETHSDLLLRAIQTAVANQKIPKENVILHWFERNAKDGLTKITPAELDEAGAFGEWPSDFGNVYLDAEGAYLDAAQARQLGQ